MAGEHAVKLAYWEHLVQGTLNGHAWLYIDGHKPRKIFVVATAEGAQKAVGLIKSLDITNFVLFNADQFDKAILLMSVAMLLKDLPGAIVYTENARLFVDSAFPGISKGKLNKDEWKKFGEKVKAEK